MDCVSTGLSDWLLQNMIHKNVRQASCRRRWFLSVLYVIWLVDDMAIGPLLVEKGFTCEGYGLGVLCVLSRSGLPCFRKLGSMPGFQRS